MQFLGIYDNEYVYEGEMQKQCIHWDSQWECRNKASYRSIRSLKDCMPDINLVWIWVIDNSVLDQQKDF